MTEVDGVPDWYLAACLRAVAIYLAQKRAHLDRPTDEQILRYWHALLEAAPEDHDDAKVAR